MKELLVSIISAPFLFSVIRVTTPIVLPSLGALITNKAGVPNIGLEGTMLMSALAGVVGSAFSGSATVGLICAILTGVLMSSILAYFTLKLKTDVILGGIALNLFSSGASVFILYVLTGDKGTSSALASKVLPNIAIPIIEKIPVLGAILSGHNVLTYLGILMIFIIWFIITKTPLGLQIKAAGENENAAASVGINVGRIRFISFVISGILCGIAGAFLSMGYVSWFSRDMTSSRGWIALAAEAMGKGSVMGTVLSSLLFGFASALSNFLQLYEIPAELISTLPYVVTVIALVIYGLKENTKIRKKVGKKHAQKETESTH